jgi:hypothetical protein
VLVELRRLAVSSKYVFRSAAANCANVSMKGHARADIFLP